MTDVAADQQPALSVSSAILGDVVWLMSRSPLHSQWTLASIHRWVTPALVTRQFRLYRDKGIPVAYASWAHLSVEAEQGYVRNAINLRPDQWQSGDRLWFIDLIGEGGFGRKALLDLRNNIFADSVARALRWKKGSDVMSIYYLHGRNAVAKSRDHNASPTVELGAMRSAAE